MNAVGGDKIDKVPSAASAVPSSLLAFKICIAARTGPEVSSSNKFQLPNSDISLSPYLNPYSNPNPYIQIQIHI